MNNKILVDLRSLKDMNCGFGQFSYHLGKAIAKNNIAKNLTFMLPKTATDYFNNVPYELASKWKRRPAYSFIKYIFPQKKYDLWHSTEQFSKFFPFHNSTPMILTIHDLNFLREKNKKKITLYNNRLQRRVDRAAVITTISNFVATEIKDKLDLKGKEVRVIYNGLNVSDSPPKKPMFSQVNKDFLFTIGQVVPKKNFHVLLDFLEKTPYNLVIAGQNSSSYAQFIKKTIADNQLNTRVIIPGVVDEAEKKWLYQNCTAFVFPSLTEGFGLPVIEAMHYGKPVFMSNSTSLPEVGGGVGFYWDNYKPEHMLEILEQGLKHYSDKPDFKKDLVSHSKKFSWNSAAQEYLKLYDEILGGL
ncbi:MAG: glycosyltransferase family 1 protein [Thiothrix sp.]|nr:MAG: glycosyltransferase family 1 protein [Thiothrix sp.]